MTCSYFEIEWPNGRRSIGKPGSSWIDLALEAGIVIPTGCLTGSCGACEIEVNGEIIRSCITSISNSESCKLKVDLVTDPFW